MAKHDKKPAPFNDAFGALKALQKAKPAEPAKAAPAMRVTEQPKKKVLDDEAAMFLAAVGEVEQVRRGPSKVAPPPPRKAEEVPLTSDDVESLAQLAELVSGDSDFEVADSTEFIEGSVRGLDARVMRKLRGGDFAPQGNVDLHGMTKAQAKPALEAFLQRARVAGHRCVLIVTGRGLHSKDEIPVIKLSVQEWLTRGHVAKQVLAFCSARPQDGGAGAVYVLLRR